MQPNSNVQNFPSCTGNFLHNSTKRTVGMSSFFYLYFLVFEFWPLVGCDTLSLLSITISREGNIPLDFSKTRMSSAYHVAESIMHFFQFALARDRVVPGNRVDTVAEGFETKPRIQFELYALSKQQSVHPITKCTDTLCDADAYPHCDTSASSQKAF